MALNEQHLPPAQVLTHEVCSAHGWHHQAASHLTGDTTEQVLPADATLKKSLCACNIFQETCTVH